MRWVSLDSSRVAVSQSGVVTARAPGRVHIEPWIEGWPIGHFSAIVKVPGPLATIEVIRPRDTIIPVDTARFRAVRWDAYGNRLSDQEVAWGLADSGVASITGSGLLTALGPGVATVYAQSEGVIGSGSIRILPPVATATLSADSVTLAPGASYRPLVALRDVSGRRLVGRPVAWRTEGSGVAVSPDGLVATTGPGLGSVIATAEGRSDTLLVRVQLVSFVAVSAGADHVCGLSTAGELWCWGRNSAGQLGHGDTIRVSGPMRVPVADTWSAVSAGEGHTCAVTTGGAAYCWGIDSTGQLGTGGTIGSARPVPVVGGLTFTAIAAGYAHTCAITSSGATNCWGSALYGRLGDSTGLGVSPTPRPVYGGLSFAGLTAGADHTCGVTTVGELYCWGHAMDGQVGSGGGDRWVPTLVSGGLSWAQVGAGRFHTCAVTTAGVAHCWGQDWFGQLGTGSGPGPIQAPGVTFTAIAGGQRHSCAARSGASAYCWGASDRGQAGTAGSLPAPIGLTASAVSAGGEYTCAMTADGVYCWGSNGYGQLGVGVAGVGLSDNMSRTPLRVTGQP